MKLTKSNLNTKADTLRELSKKLDHYGYESEFLNTRLDFQEVHHCLVQYMKHFAGCVKCHKFPGDHGGPRIRHKYTQPERVYPSLLPTQASGRWSVSDPPMITISHPEYGVKLQSELTLPDYGQVWICFDLDAIEAKMVAAESDDYADLEAFNNGYDIHTITSCNMLGDSLPTNLVNPHTSTEDTAWRAARNWQGKDDKRRGLAKVRYCVLYGRDHRAAEDSAYAAEYVKQGGDRKELVEAARLFLKSKPNLVACKKKWWNTYGRSNEARTFLGRRRRLFGDEWSRQKEGWNHRIQGGVTDMINIAIIEIFTKHPYWWLIYPSHDAAKISLPLSEFAQRPEQIVRDCKMAVEKMWTINNHTIKSTASWYVRYSDGRKEVIA